MWSVCLKYSVDHIAHVTVSPAPPPPSIMISDLAIKSLFKFHLTGIDGISRRVPNEVGKPGSAIYRTPMWTLHSRNTCTSTDDVRGVFQ